MNAGGAPGKGSGQKVLVPERPGLVEKNGGAVAPVELTEVGRRANAGVFEINSDALLMAASDRTAAQQLCQKKMDGTCDVIDCPCDG